MFLCFLFFDYQKRNRYGILSSIFDKHITSSKFVTLIYKIVKFEDLIVDNHRIKSSF